MVLLRGVNVGGKRTFRPSRLAQQLRHLDTVNVGAAGTFVVRRPVPRTQLRAEVVRRLPFVSDVIVCQGSEIAKLVSRDFFSGQRVGPDTVRFVSVLSRVPKSAPRLPITLPARGKWLLKVLALDGRFIVGLYRRHMKVIGYLGALDRIFGARATTRNWNTIVAIAAILTDREK